MVLPESLTREQLGALRADPRVWAQNFLRHPRDPDRNYDFKSLDGQKINYLLHDQGPLNPESWGNINVLKLARGCLKSTTLRIIANWAIHMFCHKGVEIYMTAPREGQITNFTDDLQRNIEMSGLDTIQVKDNQQYKKFELLREDERGNRFPVHSKFEADSGWGEGDALRGPHSHVGIIDEFQDIEKPAFDTFVQCIDQELPDVDHFPCIFLIGTPKRQNTFFYDIWQQTDQKTWDGGTNRFVAQSEPAEYVPSEDALEEMGVDEVDPWTVRGWHVDQYNSPLHDERAIARDRANFSPRKFANEVEAQFYSPADNLLDTETLEEQAFDASLQQCSRRQLAESFVTVGVDWGGGADKNAADTVVAVVEWITSEGDGPRGRLLTITFADEDLTATQEVQTVEQHIVQFEADRCVVDYGHGYKSMEDLQDGNETVDPDGFGETVVGAKYGNIKNKSDVTWESASGKRRFFTCDKTYAIEQSVDTIARGLFTIPTDDLAFDADHADGTKVLNQLTAPYKDYVETPSGMNKIRVVTDDGDNDDALDALTYCWLGYHKVGPQETPSVIPSVSRAGY